MIVISQSMLAKFPKKKRVTMSQTEVTRKTAVINPPMMKSSTTLKASKHRLLRGSVLKKVSLHSKSLPSMFKRKKNRWAQRFKQMRSEKIIVSS